MLWRTTEIPLDGSVVHEWVVLCQTKTISFLLVASNQKIKEVFKRGVSRQDAFKSEYIDHIENCMP